LKPWYKRFNRGHIRLGGGGGGGGVAGWPLTYFASVAYDTNNTRAGANQVSVSGFVLPYELSFSQIAVYLDITDAVGLYDFGIYTKAGALIANIGAATQPNNDLQIYPTLQGLQTIPPGLYLFGWTGNAAVVAIHFQDNALSWVFNQDIAASVGGALPAAIGAVAIAPSTASWIFQLL